MMLIILAGILLQLALVPGSGGAWEQEARGLRLQLEAVELERDTFRASLDAVEGGQDGAERLARLVSDKVRAQREREKYASNDYVSLGLLCRMTGFSGPV